MVQLHVEFLTQRDYAQQETGCIDVKPNRRKWCSAQRDFAQPAEEPETETLKNFEEFYSGDGGHKVKLEEEWERRREDGYVWRDMRNGRRVGPSK